MKNEFGILKVQYLKGSLEFKRISNEEIDLRLTNYFKTHQFLRRTDFQSLCGMVRSTAMRHLRRLRSEEKLENAGGLMQPIYIPEKGYYDHNQIITSILIDSRYESKHLPSYLLPELLPCIKQR